uniref:Bardet-Biedl syndrome 7 protein n=1 Tax=Acrobeloides nanus TaxID=290746 RepID=A0A914BVH0_9BILA
MLLNFYRLDYAQVGTTTRGCLRVIRHEQEEKKKSKSKGAGDKVIVGGQNGILLCIERKGGDTNIVFKTPPGQPITFVRLGGALQTIQDKTFIASGAQVKGFSRKGKQFLSFESNMTEAINSMYIYGVDMFLCGRNTFYHFHDCIEKSYYVCADRINDVLCLPVIEGGWVGRGITPVVACDDKTLKILDSGRLVYEVRLGDTPNTLHLFMNDGGYNRQKVLYGTKSGRLGLVDLQTSTGAILWEISTKSSSGVSAINCYRITDNSIPDIIIGKDDGLVEIYTVNENDEATFRQQYQCDESITGLDCGRVNSEQYDEIILCTYTGWVFSLTTQPMTEQNDVGTNLPPNMEIRVQQLRSELEELEMKVREERERYQDMAQNQEDTFSIVPPFAINDRFELSKEFACYALSIELVIPIDYIVLQSDVSVELIDVERNSAVVAITTPEQSSGNALLATYRCQADTTRIEMRIRSIEGQFGTLRVYISPRMHPKMCQVGFLVLY